MRRDQDTVLKTIMERWIVTRSQDMVSVFAGLFDLAMRIERDRFRSAEHYERTLLSRGCANGTKPMRLDTRLGTFTLNIPKSPGHEARFYPQSLERGR